MVTRKASDLSQFAAVLRKNFLLRTSRGPGPFGIPGFLLGWLGLTLEVALPVLFFLIMCVPRYYIKPTPLPAQFFPRAALDSLDWVMAYYQGPGAASPTGATVLFAPNSTEEVSLMTDVARALSCPLGPRTSPGSQGPADAIFIQHFGDLFPIPNRPAGCSDRQTCLGDEACYAPLLSRQLLGFASEQEAVEHALDNPKTVDGILVFRDGVGTTKVSYDIRINHTLVPDTRARLNRFEVRPGYEYRNYWFLANLQQHVNRAIIGQASGNGAAPADVRFDIKPYPWPAKVINFAAFISGGFFKLLGTLAFLPQVKSAVVSLVQEKELRLREGMKILGLHDGAYWASWTLTHFSTLFLSGVGCAVVGTYAFPHTSLGVMLVFYALAALALIAFSYFLSTLFTTQRVAGFASVMIFCAAMLPGYLMPSLVQPYGGPGWALASLLPPSAITLFVECILTAETVQRGVNWETIRVSAAAEYNFSAATVLCLLAANVVVYGLLTLYCDQVLPSEWGQRRPWYFPFSTSYWRAMLFSKPSDASNDMQLPLLADEADRGERNVAVKITGLNKVFETSDGMQKKAVNNLNLDMYKGQITSLLGHNGAGKTTTISILTGMLPATSGTATINGLSIDDDMPRIRRSLGLCPQFDILWPSITVRDHLRLYSRIKGLAGQAAADSVTSAAKDVALSDKLDMAAGELSGGEARKLSVAIAFMGSPDVVFLDEPCSTMDPYSRRFTWDVIRRNAKKCAVILTTHSMEEADVLSDRIAIMASGQLAAVGSSMALKSEFGAGYTLSVLTRPSAQPGCHSAGAALEAMVKKHVPDASLYSHVGTEVAIRLPSQARGSFAAMLRDLEANREELCINAYGLSVTTLEEVFLKVTEEAEVKLDTESPLGSVSSLPVSTTAGRVENQMIDLVSGFELYWQQLRAMLAKRAIVARRDWGASLAQIGVPLVLVLVALYARTATVRIDKLPPRGMDRHSVAFDLPAALAISSQARANVPGVAAFTSAYSASSLLETGKSQLQNWLMPIPVNDTIDGWLLNNWYVSNNHTYDALFVESLPDTVGGGGPIDGVRLTLMVNETSFHALPMAINQASNALLRLVSGRDAGITVRSHPLPALPFENSRQIETSAGNLLLVLLIMLAMAGMSASFAVFLVKEATSGSKLVQLVAGAPRSAFWLSNAAFDIMIMLMLLLATLLAFGIAGLPEFQGPRMLALSASLLLFGLASVPLTYVLHFFFNDEMHALQSINTLLTSIGTLGFLVVWILELVYSFFGSPSVFLLLTTTKAALRVTSPHYCLGQSIYCIADDFNRSHSKGVPSSPWSPEVTGRYLMWMAIQAVVYSVVTMSIEVLAGRQAALVAWLPCWAPIWNAADEPRQSDVAEEQRQARAALHEEDPDFQLVLAGVSKSFTQGVCQPPLHAVRSLWMGLRRGECLGLLGVNGAGKTTTFRLATGELAASSGDALICGESVTRELAAARSHLGYCPQVDPLLSLLTGTELLVLFASLRGVCPASIASLVSSVVRRLGLTEYASRACGTYSGGNKRKLSVSAALVGQPSVVLLDEPSAGLDPGARHFLWDYITKEVITGGRSVLLTSHSMEECEVLCGRIAIMAAGKLKCIGTPQHLKARFAEGYSLELRLEDGQDPAVPQEFISNLAARGRVIENEPCRKLFRLPTSGIDIPRIFEDIEAHKEAVGIVDYSLSQTTLEQVFLQLANQGDLGE